ncbi:hypothetical protein PsorP6_007290 [Peronosclerospora sorghi]|uniref:Uncharacterized protein n=1 Tax=Peronosclerospora sorghi TaxID=230839 RepID=A0ACC0WA92_9STRA|nr:hypothetical protein PsorP6_007290 [Peronosclerospora sorghi]
MPQTLAFAEQCPAYVYQNVNFRATVKLVDEHKAKVMGVRKLLRVSLRFHDTNDPVEEQDAVLQGASKVSIDPTTGLAQLSMSLRTLTATCDGRTFCLEVSSPDSDMEAVYSTPLSIVKEKLHVVTQPPEVWFKDEGGRERCMTVALTLLPAPGAYLEDRVVPLDIRLLYESGNKVLNQRILRLFPDMRPNMIHGRVTISFRIDDVSKNHQGQSFMLEIGPEQQDGSSMFQDIAPTRTSVIAVRSKRNKRKLSTQATPVVAASYGTRVSPRSVAGTPRTPFLGPQGGPPATHELLHGGHRMLTETHPQRARKYVATSASMGYGMLPSQHPMASVSWSTSMMQPSNTVVSPVQQQPRPQQPTPVLSPTDTSPKAVEWALAGFEIRPDGAMNTTRPIYRCPQCRRLNDVDMLAAGPSLSHSPHCVFAPPSGNGMNMMYRSQVEGLSMNQQRLQPQPQQRGYGGYHQYPAPPPTSSSTSHGSSATLVDSSALNVLQNTVNISSKPEDASPRTLAAFASTSTQRPPMTISPYMNKVTTEGAAGSSGHEQPNTGNLFESNAFHNQMGMGHHHTDKFVLTRNTPIQDDPALDSPHEAREYQQDTSASIGSVIGLSLFNEMTSMGINLDQSTKSDASLLSAFSAGLGGTSTEPPSGEEHVFYILARMYTDAQDQKLGLPAFDQFQRMVPRRVLNFMWGRKARVTDSSWFFLASF